LKEEPGCHNIRTSDIRLKRQNKSSLLVDTRKVKEYPRITGQQSWLLRPRNHAGFPEQKQRRMRQFNINKENIAHT
jgi:hypothetical protein